MDACYAPNFIPLGIIDQKLSGWINLFLVLKVGHAEHFYN